MASWKSFAVTLLGGGLLGYALGVVTAPRATPAVITPIDRASGAGRDSASGGAASPLDAPVIERRTDLPRLEGPAAASASLRERLEGAAASAPSTPAEGAAASPSAAAAEPPAEPSLRERLLAASEAERTQLLGALVTSLQGVEAAARAAQLNELFQSDGWFGDQLGPSLDPATWRLAADTLAELPEGGARDPLLQTLGQHLARARGTNAMGTLLSLSSLTLVEEQARVGGRPLDPDAEVVARLRQQLVEGATNGTLGEQAALHGAFGLGGAGASGDDQRALMRLALEGKLPRIRFAGYFALATTPPSREVDDFLVREASRGGSGWKRRAAAWQALRRRGGEEFLPRSVVQEILVEWERSGAPDLEQLLND